MRDGKNVEESKEVEVTLIEPSRLSATHCKFCMLFEKFVRQQALLGYIATPELSNEERDIINGQIMALSLSRNKYIDDETKLYADFIDLFVDDSEGNMKQMLMRDNYAAQNLMGQSEVVEVFNRFFGSTPAGLQAAEELKSKINESLQEIEDTKKE